MRGIVSRIDFYIIAIHNAIARFACSLIADESFAAFVVAATAMIQIGASINYLLGTIGRTGTRYTGIILANQTLIACI